MEPVIRFSGVTLGYGTKTVLRDVSFEVHAGEYFGLVGPNGAGKTTIVRAILGTLVPVRGSVRVTAPGGGPVRFGYVPQRDTLDYILPYSVEEIVMMGRYRQIGLVKRPGAEDREAVRESLSHVAIGDLAGRSFQELSGGQKQRALIARALASHPDILVLDEPTNGMDLSSRISILQLIDRLHEEDRLTVIMVSHLLDDVANHVTRLAIVEREFFQVGGVDEVLSGANLSTLYGMQVVVRTVEGRTVILPGGAR
ncbi:MAG: metal ABC transporter ATP-binding protein [Bacteroidota bacterium]